jgi:hypothetical protein
MRTSLPGRASPSRWPGPPRCSPGWCLSPFRSISIGFSPCGVYPAGPGESVILFLTALIACAFVLVPHQPASALGVELLLLGLLALSLLLLIVMPAVRGPSRQPTSWHAARIVGIVAMALPIVLAGASLVHWLPGELYWLVAGVLAALLVGTANAWVLLVEVVRDQRYQPVDTS